MRQAFWDTYDGRFGDVIVAHTPGKAVRRKNRGQIVLIDTGACYGGRLSAYCPETRASRSVAGDRPWFMDPVPQPIAPAPVSPSRLAAPT
ncbi:hypothetical protein [Cyanobium sp. LEGE 06113]|uniref:hypothetical protein n=1 Tax=Cyanobium sp. LEGE 06113 TaxID=1297573 RepID=UPI00351C4121